MPINRFCDVIKPCDPLFHGAGHNDRVGLAVKFFDTAEIEDTVLPQSLQGIAKGP